MKFGKLSNLRQGFSLTELMVVIAIIGILTSIAVVDYSQIKAKGRDARRALELKELDQASQKYFQDHFAYPSVITDLSEYFDPGNFPKDPETKADYGYAKIDGGYCLGVHMEVLSNSVSCGEDVLSDPSINYRIQG